MWGSKNVGGSNKMRLKTTRLARVRSNLTEHKVLFRRSEDDDARLPRMTGFHNFVGPSKVVGAHAARAIIRCGNNKVH